MLLPVLTNSPLKSFVINDYSCSYEHIKYTSILTYLNLFAKVIYGHKSPVDPSKAITTLTLSSANMSIYFKFV